MATPETQSDSRAATKKVLRIVFLCPTAEISNPNSTRHQRDRLFRLRRPPITAKQKRWQMRPNLRRPSPKLRYSKADSEDPVTDCYHWAFFWMWALDDCRAARTSQYPNSEPLREQKMRLPQFVVVWRFSNRPASSNGF
jgi:hypothetical protein